MKDVLEYYICILTVNWNYLSLQCAPTVQIVDHKTSYHANFNTFLLFANMQLLFKYPPAKKLTMRMKDLAPFCFPEGVKVCLMLFYMLIVVKVSVHFNYCLTNCSLFLSNVCI